MALLKQHDTKTGLILPSAYVRVEFIAGGKRELSATVAIYSSKEASVANKKELEYFDFPFAPDMTGENFIRQAYLHLKTLPEFADAEDC